MAQNAQPMVKFQPLVQNVHPGVSEGKTMRLVQIHPGVSLLFAKNYFCEKKDLVGCITVNCPIQLLCHEIVIVAAYKNWK